MKGSTDSASCRICHGRQSPLIRACGCRGTCGSIHAVCVQLWIAHRQAAGINVTDATTCELCLEPFAHRLERAPMLRFFLSPASWRAWAHMAYLAVCARRVCTAAASALRSATVDNSNCIAQPHHSRPYVRQLLHLLFRHLTAQTPDKLTTAPPAQTPSRNMSRMRVTLMLGIHYCLLLLLDARLLLAVFRRWRVATTKVVVCDKGADSPAEPAQLDIHASPSADTP